MIRTSLDAGVLIAIVRGLPDYARAAAVMLGADELVTTEGLQKPIHRATNVNVVTI